ncbi:MAG: hypothetical protein PHD13_07135 [Methanocellales archaeon]|nr:hypothetical protein [Methanocellales archaeon]MDD3291542.1 hypothetical protein [Methanocellales archaeon]MDD5235932.1 hypothetical protein [Methanocellales archaeon]MDD5485324.1 hypothetical protein [Methanocellales archaeon]
MTNLRTLKYLLNYNDLTDDWNLSYGITKNRSDALLTSPKHSFFNPLSETALTLFLLGNIDGWKQIGTLNIFPRDKDSKWNKTFFDNIRSSINIFNNIPSRDNLWLYNREFKEKIFGSDEIDIHRSILLFEFEMMNSAFHPVQRKAFKDLSFVAIRNMRKWSKFDAVLIVPNEKLFIFFESKLTSDISQNTKKYPYINQIMRNLESAFLLTNHRNSLYKDWKFRYVFICPRKIDQYRLTRYSWVLNSIEKSISIFREIINNEYESSINKECYSEFELFARQIPSCIIKVYWDDIGNILESKDRKFFNNYLDRLEGAGLEEEKIENIKERFRKVGMNVS